MGKDNNLVRSCEDDIVISDDRAAAYGRDSDFLRITLLVALASVINIVVLVVHCLIQAVSQGDGRSARGIAFQFVVFLHDLHIKACSLLSDEKIQRVNTIYPTRTKTTEAYRYTLKELESETFLKIIRGESELSAFNEFVKEWQEEGGNEIIQEMIQERKSLNSQEEQKTEEKAEQKAE